MLNIKFYLYICLVFIIWLQLAVIVFSTHKTNFVIWYDTLVVNPIVYLLICIGFIHNSCVVTNIISTSIPHTTCKQEKDETLFSKNRKMKRYLTYISVIILSEATTTAQIPPSWSETPSRQIGNLVENRTNLYIIINASTNLESTTTHGPSNRPWIQDL